MERKIYTSELRSVFEDQKNSVASRHFFGRSYQSVLFLNTLDICRKTKKIAFQKGHIFYISVILKQLLVCLYQVPLNLFLCLAHRKSSFVFGQLLLRREKKQPKETYTKSFVGGTFPQVGSQMTLFFAIDWVGFFFFFFLESLLTPRAHLRINHTHQQNMHAGLTRASTSDTV